MNIVHVITGLRVGGAEMMLYQLLAATQPRSIRSQVVSLGMEGAMVDRIRELGVAVHFLGMRRGVPDPYAVIRLNRWLKRQRPDLVQTWMYHADLVGGVAARLAGIPVVWGVHHSSLEQKTTRRSTLLTVQACVWVSGCLPKKIVCVSKVSRELHARLGYPADKMVVIPNGFDLQTFHPDPQARQDIREELGIDNDTPLVGMLARFHPQKDHANFIAAAAALHRCMPQARFLLCGEGITWENETLTRLIHHHQLSSAFHLLGLRQDAPRMYAALDLLASSSFGEAFPLVIGEAMACGVPCVVTDVGDSALIVGGTGRVVPPRNPAALAAAWEELLRMPSAERSRLGSAARQRIQEHYSIEQVAGQYEALYSSILAEGRA